MRYALIAMLLLAGVAHAQQDPVPLAMPAHRTADKAWWTATAVSWGLTVADTEYTLHSLRNPNVREVNPILGPHPSRAKLYAFDVPITAFETYMSYRWKKQDDYDIAHNRKPAALRWYLFPVVNSAVHGVAIGLSIVLTR